ncbi:hypothetical protein Tco_0713623 [Tanacetum coccineum]
MAIGTGHRSNNYSESKRNDHLDNNRRQEQRNKGIPNKSHPNFREEHKSFSSIFVSNIPWNASVQDPLGVLKQMGCGEPDVFEHSCKENPKIGSSIWVLGTLGLVGRSTIWNPSGKRQDSKAIKEIFIGVQRCGLQASWAPEIYKKLGGSVGSSVFTDKERMDQRLHGKVCVLQCHYIEVIESFKALYRKRTYRIIATELHIGRTNNESLEVNSSPNPLERKEQRLHGKEFEDDCLDITPVIAPEKDSIIAPPSTTPGNDLNIAVESGSSWIDYIGPLTSDDIDSGITMEL